MASSALHVGVSVSESASLPRLGLSEKHLELALGEVARVTLRSGHKLVYGGHLRDGGYTGFLASEVERYGRTDSPLQLVVGWSEHRPMTLSELQSHRDGLGLFGQVTYLDEQGHGVEANHERGEAAESVDDAGQALSAMRRYLADCTNARVLIGGKLQGFQGGMPGIVEEAALAVAAEQPVYLAGGFGGATGVLAATAFEIDSPLGWESDGVFDETFDHARDAVGSGLPPNGLSPEQNRRLATTYRPSEVAWLVSTGLQQIAREQS
jgi:hypothetical protein